MSTDPVNSFSRSLQRFGWLPAPVTRRVVGLVFGRVSPFFRMTRIKIVELGSQQVTLGLTNHRRVRNHIESIHAVAITLACEYASGLLVPVSVHPTEEHPCTQ